MTAIQRILKERGWDIRPRYLRPSPEQLKALEVPGYNMSMYRFHCLVNGDKPILLLEAVKMSQWLGCELKDLIDEDLLNQ